MSGKIHAGGTGELEAQKASWPFERPVLSRMLSSCLRMRLEESGRLLILAMIPATKGEMVAAPAPISANAVRWRAACSNLSAISRPTPKPTAA